MQRPIVWQVDAERSMISFKAPYLAMNEVTGWLLRFEGHVRQQVPSSFVDAVFRFKGRSDSIFTGNELRDRHLKSEDFLDAEEHPWLYFNSTKVDGIDNEHYFINGILTIKDRDHELLLTAHDCGPVGKDGARPGRMAMDMMAQIKLSELGIPWFEEIDRNGMPPEPEINLLIHLQLEHR